MKDRPSSPRLLIVLQLPFALAFLFLFYSIGSRFVRMVKGFSVPLGLSDTLVNGISAFMLIFLLFICCHICVHFLHHGSGK